MKFKKKKNFMEDLSEKLYELDVERILVSDTYIKFRKYNSIETLPEKFLITMDYRKIILTIFFEECEYKVKGSAKSVLKFIEKYEGKECFNSMKARKTKTS